MRFDSSELSPAPNLLLFWPPITSMSPSWVPTCMFYLHSPVCMSLPQRFLRAQTMPSMPLHKPTALKCWVHNRDPVKTYMQARRQQLELDMDLGLEGPIFLLLLPFLGVCGGGNLLNIISLLACLIWLHFEVLVSFSLFPEAKKMKIYLSFNYEQLGWVFLSALEKFLSMQSLACF